MKNNLKTYMNRINKLNYRIKHLHKDINQFNELTKEIKRLNKIIKFKKFKMENEFKNKFKKVK